MAAVRGFPMDTDEAKELGERFSGAFHKWERDKQELEAVHQARHGFMGEQSNSSMQHSPAMAKMLQEGSKLLQAHSNSQLNHVEDGDERTVHQALSISSSSTMNLQRTLQVEGAVVRLAKEYDRWPKFRKFVGKVMT